MANPVDSNGNRIRLWLPNQSVTANLTVRTTLSVAYTFYDGPSVILAPGKWLVLAHGLITPAGSTAIVGKLWDGANVFATSEPYNALGEINLAAIITLLTQTTIKASYAETSGTTGHLEITSSDGGGSGSAVGPATWIVAVPTL